MKRLQASVRPTLPLERDISVFIDLNLWEKASEEASEEGPEEGAEEALFEPNENQDLVPTVQSVQAAEALEQLQRAYRERLARSRGQFQLASLKGVPFVTEREAAPIRITGVQLVNDLDVVTDGWDHVAGRPLYPRVMDEKPVPRVMDELPVPRVEEDLAVRTVEEVVPQARASWRVRMRRGWAWLRDRLRGSVRGGVG